MDSMINQSIANIEAFAGSIDPVVEEVPIKEKTRRRLSRIQRKVTQFVRKPIIDEEDQGAEDHPNLIDIISPNECTPIQNKPQVIVEPGSEASNDIAMLTDEQIAAKDELTKAETPIDEKKEFPSRNNSIKISKTPKSIMKKNPEPAMNRFLHNFIANKRSQSVDTNESGEPRTPPTTPTTPTTTSRIPRFPDKASKSSPKVARKAPNRNSTGSKGGRRKI